MPKTRDPTEDQNWHPAHVTRHEPDLAPFCLECYECGTSWNTSVIFRVPLEVTLAHVQSLRCPNCDADSKKIGLARNWSR